MKLSQLPNDLLAQIAPFQVLLELIKCGDPFLNAKIVSGVRHVALALHPCGKPRPPKIIAQLTALHSFSIKSDKYLCKTIHEASNLTKALPPTLEMLEIVCKNSREWIMNLDPSSTSSAVTYVYTQYPRGLSPFLDLEQLFPRLHTLKLSASFDSKDLAGLPSSLTYFYAAIIWFGPTVGLSLSVLPPSLKCLDGVLTILAFKVSSHAAILEDWSKRHPQLEQLGDIFFYDREFAPYLPRDIPIRSIDYYCWDAALFSALPDCIQHLEVKALQKQDFIQIPWTSLLPRKLLSLSVLPETDSIGLILSHLPKSLTSLTFKSFGNLKASEILEYGEKADIWPPNLTVLHRLNICDLSDLSLMPSTITSLRIQIPSELGANVILLDGSLLPPQLTEMVMNRVETAIQLSSPLPATLKILKIDSTSRSRIKFNQESFEMIPDSLTHLSILPDLHSIPYESEALYKLPSCLTCLNLHAWRFDWIEAIPKSVTKLKLHFPTRPSEENASDIFSSFPTKLRELTLATNDPEEFEDTHFPDDSLVTLPHLEALYVQFGRFRSSFIRNLPRSLIKLEIELEKLDDIDAPFLSPRIVELDLGPVDWNNPAIAEYWPIAANSPRMPARCRTRTRQRDRLAELNA